MTDHQPHESFAQAVTEDGKFITFKTPIGRIRAQWPCCPADSLPACDLRIQSCLGIQYADIPFRWASPRKSKLPWPGLRDCTDFGPGCPQTLRPLFDVDGIPLFGRLGPSSIAVRAKKYDELRCLNLNIFTPVNMDRLGTITIKDKLPVLVWTHGGSYQVGSGSVSVYGESHGSSESLHGSTPATDALQMVPSWWDVQSRSACL